MIILANFHVAQSRGTDFAGCHSLHEYPLLEILPVLKTLCVARAGACFVDIYVFMCHGGSSKFAVRRPVGRKLFVLIFSSTFDRFATATHRMVVAFSTAVGRLLSLQLVAVFLIH